MNTLLKQSLIITILLIGSIANVTSAQVFTLTSFTGAKKLITVSSISEKGRVSIMSLKDTIIIRDVYTIEKVALLAPNFLMLTCSVRAGSDMRLEKTWVVCAKGDHICESLRISSLFKEDFLDFSKPVKGPIKVSVKTRYKAEFILTGVNASEYRLQTKVHGERKSIKKSADDYFYNSVANLRFDTTLNIFYDDKRHLAQAFNIFDSKTNRESKQYIKGTFPMIKLGDYKYYFIRGEWYESDVPDKLSK